MHEDSDTASEGNRSASAASGIHAEYLELVQQAKGFLPVVFRPDGPPLAFVFDDPPLPEGQGGDDADAPFKRKRVMVDGYEMEDDGEDGMNVSQHASFVRTSDNITERLTNSAVFLTSLHKSARPKTCTELCSAMLQGRVSCSSCSASMASQ